MSFIDHYIVLGLPTGEEGAKLTARQIAQAYKFKALEVHPDKRPGREAEEARVQFQKLKASYEVLSDPRKRQGFHALLLSLRQQQQQTRFVRVVRKEENKRKYEDGPDDHYQESETKKRATGDDDESDEVFKKFEKKFSAFLARAAENLQESEEKIAQVKKIKKEISGFFAGITRPEFQESEILIEMCARISRQMDKCSFFTDKKM